MDNHHITLDRLKKIEIQANDLAKQFQFIRGIDFEKAVDDLQKLANELGEIINEFSNTQKLTKRAMVGSTVFNEGVDQSVVIRSAQRNFSRNKQKFGNSLCLTSALLVEQAKQKQGE